MTRGVRNPHRRMRRGGRGGCSPPQLLATQFFGQRRSFFWAAAMVGGGCFSIFRRANDVTQTMSKGGGVLVNVQEWGCFSIFRRRMTSRRQCPRGGVLVKSPPPFRKSCYLCKILGSQPLRPLTKAVPYAYGNPVRSLSRPYKVRHLALDCE